MGAGLLGILLVSYILTIYVTVIALGTFPFGETPSGSLSPANQPWYVNLVAVILLALTIWPVSRWLNHGINELVFGQQDNPYALPSMINRQLREMQFPQLTLPAISENVATALHLPYVAIELDGDEGRVFAYGSGQTHTTRHLFPLQYLDQPLGRLIASGRSANYPLSQSDRQVLQEIAQQIGIALYLANMTEVLQSSREEIVVAREEERRRIRNDLHDGLAPTLSSFQLQLGAIRRLLVVNPKEAEIIIQELGGDLKQATQNIRDLVYHLRPPMLDELGLVGAIQNLALLDDHFRLELDVPDPLPPLSAATEVALYRIVTEAVHNIAKHANATTCTVRMTTDPEVLSLTIADDGQGMPTDHSNGIGLQSMRERAAELGGTFSIQPADPSGTCIEVRLPWRDRHR
jgi:two-component system NarL family sensor kinase